MAAIVKTASYDATCSNPKKCNKPNYTIDERGNRTDYTYDATNGEVTRIQLPAATSGGTRPEIRYAYTQYYAQIRNSSGPLVNTARKSVVEGKSGSAREDLGCRRHIKKKKKTTHKKI